MSNKKNNHNHKKRIAMISVHSDPSAKLGGHETGGQNVYVSELSRPTAGASQGNLES